MALVVRVAGSKGLSWRKIAPLIRTLPLIPGTILAGVIFTAIFAPVLAPCNPGVHNLAMKLTAPFEDPSYILGTDAMGRDILSRLIFGARVSLLVGFLSIAFAGAVGGILGLASGYIRGRFDTVVWTVINMQMAIPFLVLALLLATVIGVGLWNMIIVLGIAFWTGYARVVRGETMAVKELDYIALAKVTGCGRLRIMLTHILPNVTPSLIVMSTLQMGTAIIAEAGLSFLGLGVQPPTAAWGLMLADGRSYIILAWWLAFFPGLAITVTVLGTNLMGDWLRDHLDPKRRQI